MSTSKNKLAGKASGARRAKFAKVRQLHVLMAFEQLKPTYQMQPFSDEALHALEEEFRKPLKRHHPDVDDDEVIVSSMTFQNRVDFTRPFPRRRVPSQKLIDLLFEVGAAEASPSLYNASRETLVKDLKALGIRSKRRKKESG